MNEQEAQQAEISEIRELNNLSIELGGDTPAIWRCHVLLKIVDSQAQKITELSALFQKAGNGAIDLAMKCSEQELKIAEQAKEIERLKDDLLQARGCAEGMADSHAILDGDESEIEHRLQMRRKRRPLPWEKP